MFQKIYQFMRLMVALALLLTIVLILCVLYAVLDPAHTRFLAIATIAVLSALTVYLVFARIAIAVAKGITDPIKQAAENGFTATDDIYEELKPLFSRLTTQGSELKRQSNKAKSQKLQLQTITENMNEGLMILDQDMHVLAINKCAQEIFSLQEREIKYKSILEIPECGMFSKGLKKASEGNNNDLIFSSGNKTYQIFFTPVLENDIVAGVVILLFDVSQRQRAEQIRREFSANVSHELKTPLTAISGYAQIITNGLAKPEDIHGFAQKIDKETSRLITLIDDIIALSALEENGSEAEKESVALKEVAEEVFESLENSASKHNVTLQISGDDIIVTANRRQMTELMFNLCDNAIKYNKPGGSVMVYITRNTLSVSDTGIGIPPDSIDRIFERFYRVDKSHSKKVNGTGLGLSIVKHIAQCNNAEISVKSILGEGSTFTVVFH